MARGRKESKLQIFPKKIDINFYHKNSEVSYDPSNKFYQITFPFQFEKEVYSFIDTFIDLIFSDEKFKDFGALPRDRNMTDFYFHIMSEFANINWAKYSKWYFERKAALSLSMKRIILNSIKQQGQLKIDDLEFFAWLSIASVTADVMEEYFIRHFEKFNVMKDTLFYLLGEIFEMMLREIYDDSEIEKTRVEQTGGSGKKPETLINRYVLVYNDIADTPQIEKIMFGKDKRILVDRATVSKVIGYFDEMVKKSKQIEKHDNLKYVLADPGMVKLILSNKNDKKYLRKLIQKDKDLKGRLIFRYGKEKVRRLIYGVVTEIGSSELLSFVRDEETLGDIFYDNEVRKYIVKLLKDVKGTTSRELLKSIYDTCDKMDRSGNTFFNRLFNKELDEIIAIGIDNISYYLRCLNNFTAIREKYGKKSSYKEESIGIKVLRQSKIKSIAPEEGGKERLECIMAPEDERTRIENMFEEGNVFYFREEGAVYPGTESGMTRGKKTFLFADLRNSTETTMRLTKDTAVFLTPYLNTVYKAVTGQGGVEIYFAGDGFAAHFAKTVDCVRAAYLVHNEFAKLRKESDEKVKINEKALFKELIKREIITDEGKLNKKIQPDDKMPENILAFLKMAWEGNIKLQEALIKTAEQFSMPRVEIGIGLSLGDLFIAVIGGEGDVKFNIVLSPSLNQAARLSGSNAEVKAYLEKLYGSKNIPRKVYVQNRKLFNHGVVLTIDVFNNLRKEVEVNLLESGKTDLSYDVFYYYDKVLDKYIALGKMEEGLSLKGIDEFVEVFEVFTVSSDVEILVNNWVKNRK